MKILTIIPYWGGIFGGPTFLAGDLALRLKTRNHAVSLLTTKNTPCAEREEHFQRIGADRLALVTDIAPVNDSLYRFSFEFMKKCDDLVAQSDLVLIHCLWQFPSTYAAHICRKMKKPYMIFTHNMLTPWSFGHKPLRKWAYFNLIEKRNLNGAKAVFGMREDELKLMAQLGIRAPEKRVFQIEIFREDVVRFKALRDGFKKNQAWGAKKTLLFLSRIHPKKGLLNLILALPRVING